MCKCKKSEGQNSRNCREDLLRVDCHAEERVARGLDRLQQPSGKERDSHEDGKNKESKSIYHSGIILFVAKIVIFLV